MGQRSRPKPEHLAAKLLTIRLSLGVGQYTLARLLGLDPKVSFARISEYERGLREPNLLVLLSYGRLVGISTDVLIDDNLSLPEQIKLKRRRK